MKRYVAIGTLALLSVAQLSYGAGSYQTNRPKSNQIYPDSNYSNINSGYQDSPYQTNSASEQAEGYYRTPQYRGDTDNQQSSYIPAQNAQGKPNGKKIAWPPMSQSAEQTSANATREQLDEALSEKIRQAITSDPSLSSVVKNLKITTQNSVVTLRGSVKEKYQIATIEWVAKNTPGVYSVDNKLYIKNTK